MAKLKPWAIGPFELLRHADLHRHDGGDFDRRMAVISYDNAIELTITTYLGLHPLQRANRSFPQVDVTKWLKNYHSKLDFFEHYVRTFLDGRMLVERAEIIYYHRIRNDLYHEDSASVPKREDVDALRAIAVWVFSALFNVEVEPLLAAETSGRPVEIESTHAQSPENEVFAAVIELRKVIAALRDLIGATSAATPTDEQVLASVLKSETPATSQHLIEALKKGEEVANSLSEEQAVAANPQELGRLQQLLQQLKARVEVPLREHQATFAVEAVEATLEAIREQRREVGYVCQAEGSGLSRTVEAYVTLLLDQPELRHYAILVVADRSVLCHQLHDRLKHLDGRGTRILHGMDNKELTEDSPPPGSITLMTVQALTQALARDPLHNEVFLIAKDVLLIAYGFDVISHSVRSLLPQAYVIAFTNRLRGLAEPPAHVIGHYSISEAIEAVYATPLTMEQRYLSATGVADRFEPALDEWQEAEVDAAFEPKGFRWTALGLQLLAADIITHFAKRQQAFPGKALVVVDSVETANRLCDALRAAAVETKLGDESYVAVLASNLATDEVYRLIRNFRWESTQPHMIVSARMWTGIDVPLLHCAYITCPLGRNTLLKLTGRLASLHQHKTVATIVDYAMNRFDRLDVFPHPQAPQTLS